MQSFSLNGKFPVSFQNVPDGAMFDFYGGASPTLVFHFKKPRKEEIEAVQAGPIQIGILFYKDVILIPIYEPRLGYMDCTYNYHLYKDVVPTVSRIELGTGFGLSLFMVDSDDNTIKAMRLCGMSSSWTAFFRDSLEEQKKLPFDSHEYNLHIQDVYSRMDSKELLKKSSVVYTLGE